MASSYDQHSFNSPPTGYTQSYQQSLPQNQQYSQFQQTQQQQRQSADYFPPSSPSYNNNSNPSGYNYDQQLQPQQPPQPLSPSSPPTTSSNKDHTRRRSRGFSLNSNKSGSHKSSNLTETSAEKSARRLHSKADPTLAMNEAEPATVAAMQQVSMPSLRSIQHKDALGNLIVDPDLSNPTRSRWERPLDTIRSFEAAIDGNYSLRQTHQPASKERWAKRASVYSNTPRDAYRTSYYGPANNYSDPPQQRPRNQPNFYNNSYQTTGSGASGDEAVDPGNNYSMGYSAPAPVLAPIAVAAPAPSRTAVVPPPDEKRKSWFKKKFRK